METITGSWRQDRSNKAEAEAFMKSVGMPDELVKRHVDREYVLTYKVEGTKLACKVKVENEASLGEKDYLIDMGQEAEIDSIDNEKTKLLVKFEDGKFVEKYQDLVRGGTYDVTRQIAGDVMTVTTTMGDNKLAMRWVRC